MDNIDELDRAILRKLMQDARKPYKEVAEACGVSRAAIHQRVKRMQEIGAIYGSRFDINPQQLGYQLCVFVGITLEKGSMYDQVVAALEHIPEVTESYFTLGAYSMLIKLHARDDKHLLFLINKKIQSLPGVANTETLTALDQRIRRDIPIE